MNERNMDTIQGASNQDLDVDPQTIQPADLPLDVAATIIELTRNEGVTMPELDLSKVEVTVTGELSFGYGSITAESVSDEVATERAEKLKTCLEPVEDGVGCGCIDGRCLLHSLSGNEAKVGPKLAGGAHISTFYAAEIDGFFEDDRTALDHLADVMVALEKGGEAFRMHGDSNDAAAVEEALVGEWKTELENTPTIEAFIEKLNAAELPSTSGCGFDDGFEGAIAKRGADPIQYKDKLDSTMKTETAEQAVERVAFIKTYTQALLGEAFDEAKFDAHTAKTTELVRSGFFKGWSSIKVALLAQKMLMTVGSTDSVMDRFDVLEATDEGVHGHIEEVVAVSFVKKHTLNTTRYMRETGHMAFAVDAWKAPECEAKIVADKKPADGGITSGIVEAQLAGYVGLGDGKQRVNILKMAA